MKQNLHYFFSILLTIILLSPPAAVWADAPEPLTFTALTAGSKVKLNACTAGDNSNTNMKLQNYLTVSTDGVNYRPIAVNTDYTLTNIGDKLYVHGHLKDNGTGYKGLNKAANAGYWNKFLCTGSVEISGDLVSLIDSATFVSTLPQNYCFYGAFGGSNMSTATNQQAIKSAEHLRISSRPITLTQGACESLMYNNRKMTIGPDFSTAMTLSGTYCFKEAFKFCYALTSMGGDGLLNATTLSNYCYNLMFRTCTCLTSVPVSFPPSTTIGEHSCDEMFGYCSGLTNVDDLMDNVTSIGNYGCQNMFTNCSGLTRIGAINVTTIGNYGCSNMFNACTKLSSINHINATTSIGNYGCQNMFNGCTGLRDCSSAHLKAKNVGNWAYYRMFLGCTNGTPVGITHAPQIDATTMGIGACDSMFYNCSTLVYPPDTLHPVSLPKVACKYMFFGCKALIYSPVIEASSVGREACYTMFNGCTKLETIGKLFDEHAIIQRMGCYQMFKGCTTLSTIPDLNGDSIGGRGCEQMFCGCTGLRDCSSAHLRPRAIGDSCYLQMFATSTTTATAGITKAPQIDAKKVHIRSCMEMFKYASTLTQGPDTLHAERLTTASYASMFWSCSTLVKSPIIKATVVYSSNSVGSMNLTFRGCNVVNNVEARFTSWTTYGTNNWLYDAPSSGTFICSSSLSTATRDKSHIPSGWNILFYPVVTFSVATDRHDVATGGTWEDNTNANITGDWYGDGPFPTAIHDSKNFRGWVDADGNTVTWESAAVARANPANTITLYADFTDSEYTLEWDFNGGATSTPEEDYTHGMIEAETPITPPANPTRNGYAFNGWNATPASTMPAENVTYTAQWTAINYTFDVATNGGTWDGSDDDNKVLTVASLPGTPQKDKYLFERWNTSEDGTGTDMDAEALPSEATKYYAIFVKVDFFRFIAQNATTISSAKAGSPVLPSLSYSTDAGLTWNTFTIGTTSVNLAAGDSILFKGINASGLNGGIENASNNAAPSAPYWYFTSTDSVSVAGNIMTLIQGTSPTNTITANNCFAAIMKGMPLVSAAELVLPTTTRSGCYKYMFYNSSLRIAPELPALDVAAYAYQGMFSACTKLRTAPEIPATTVGTASMRAMFHSDENLTQAPSELQAQTLGTSSYNNMFYSCVKLQMAPIIRAINIDAPENSDAAAMGSMFRNCSTLNYVSVRFKAWKVKDISSPYATNTWFYDAQDTGIFVCPSALDNTTRNTNHVPSDWTINYIPELTFDVNTNGGTWNDASTTARVLEPETTWTIPEDVTAPANRTFVGWNTEADGTGYWLTDENKPVISTTAVIRTYYAIYAMNLTFNVASVGATWDGSANDTRTYTDVQFRRGEIPSPQRGEDEVRTAWVTAGGDTLKANSVLTPGTVYTPTFAEYLCITAQTDNVGVGIGSIGTGSTITFNLYYSTDGMNWKKASGSPFKTINTGEKLYLRGTNANGINTTANGAAYGSNHYIKFNITNNATLSGNLMYLIHPTTPPTTIPNTHCFAKLFKHDSNNATRYCKITDASRLKLPATTLTASCYEGLFHDCQYLIYAPKLPATELAANCYMYMFYNCSALRRMEVAFDDWSDDGSGNPAYTNQWLYGTTTDANANARFIGPAVLFEHVRNNGHIQTNWKGMDFVLLDDQADSYYTDLKDMEGLALQQVTFKGTFPAKRWITFNVPFDFYIPEDHPFADHVYQFLGADGNADEGFDIHFQGGVYELEAGMPYLYYGDEQQIDPVFAADGEDNLILTIDADALDAANSVCTGDPLVNTSNAEFRGTVKLTPLPGGDKRYIFISGNRLYYPHASGNWLYAFSGYFFVPSVSSVAPRVRMMVNGQETSVEIEEFGANGQAAEAGIKKYIQDGVMVIERNGVKYDAQGHKLN